MNYLSIRFIPIFLTFLVFLPHAGTGQEDSGFAFDRNRRFINLPIEVRNNLAVVPLYINGAGPLYFILDTGVKTTILTEPIITHLLDLNIEETILLYGLGGEGTVQAALATGVEIRMRGITGRNMNLIIIPEDILSFSEIFGFPVYGIIGHDFFRHFPVEINYPTQTMRVYRDPDYRIRRRSTVVPIRLVDGKPYVESRIVGEAGDTLTTNLLIDLGASSPLYLNREYSFLSDRTIDGYLGKGISGNLLGKHGRVEKLEIGEAIAIHEPLAAYPDARFLTFHGQLIDWEGIIGGGIIKRFNVIIDYRSERLVLSRSQFYGEPFSAGMSGIEVMARGPDLRDFTIHYVRPGSPGYEAGLQSGDKILELNRTGRHYLNMESILDELSGKEGNYISMVVQRNEQIVRARFRLRQDI